MAEKRFDIIFRGELLEGQDPTVVRGQVARLCNVPDARVEHLFSGRPVIIKKSADLDTAGRFALAFRRAGAVAELVPSATAEIGQATVTNSQTLTALPPNTGSLEDCAPTITPAALPDISNLTMATPGVQLDRSQSPVPPAIDTSELNLVPGQNWTLEDCAAQFPPPALPNIPKFTISSPGAVLDDTPAPSPALIKIGSLELVTAKNWSLEDCQPPPPAAPKLNLSGLTLADPIVTDQ